MSFEYRDERPTRTLEMEASLALRELRKRGEFAFLRGLCRGELVLVEEEEAKRSKQEAE